jgi:hypothetical protein
MIPAHDYHARTLIKMMEKREGNDLEGFSFPLYGETPPNHTRSIEIQKISNGYL